MASKKPIKCEGVEIRAEHGRTTWGSHGFGVDIHVYLQGPHRHANERKLRRKLEALIERHIDELVEVTTPCTEEGDMGEKRKRTLRPRRAWRG